MKRVLMTGATGFVGANLAEELVRAGHDVYVIVRDGYQEWRIKHLLQDIHLICVNLLDRASLQKVVEQIHPEWIFHLATYGAYSWQENLDTAIQTNFLSTVNLVEVCKGIGFEAFINTGSSSEYGLKEYAPVEDDFLEPNSYYAVTKASATLFCSYTAQRYHLPIYTLRLYSVYGPYEDPKRLIPTLILNGLQTAWPPLVHPSIARDFIFTEDVNNAYIHVASSGTILPAGSVYNVGTGTQTTLQDIATITKDFFDIKEEPKWGTMENRSWDTNIWVANNQKLREIGWLPRYDFQSGYKKTIDWFKQNPSLIQQVYTQSNNKT